MKTFKTILIFSFWLFTTACAVLWLDEDMNDNAFVFWLIAASINTIILFGHCCNLYLHFTRDKNSD